MFIETPDEFLYCCLSRVICNQSDQNKFRPMVYNIKVGFTIKFENITGSAGPGFTTGKCIEQSLFVDDSEKTDKNYTFQLNW